MKYKHSRQELRTWFHINIGFDSIAEKHFEKMLLAQKEDKKECKHKLGDKEEHDNLGTYHIAGDTCVKCGKHIMDWDNPTPSPLEEIEKVKFGMDSNQTFENFYDKINEIIRTVNKLIKNSPIEANSGDMEDRNDSSVNDEMKENYKLREEK